MVLNAVSSTLGFGARIGFSLRILFDGTLAARLLELADAPPQLPQAEAEPEPEPESEPDPAPVSAPAPDTSALVLLSLLQREGRLVDFLQQDIADFDDAEIGAAARVVHEGCGKALRGHAAIAALREEEEETSVEVSEGIDSGAVKLTGKVSGKPPYKGVLRHKGWRISDLTLPTPVEGHDPTVIAPAEVEL